MHIIRDRMHSLRGATGRPAPVKTCNPVHTVDSRCARLPRHLRPLTTTCNDSEYSPAGHRSSTSRPTSAPKPPRAPSPPVASTPTSRLVRTTKLPATQDAPARLAVIARAVAAPEAPSQAAPPTEKTQKTRQPKFITAPPLDDITPPQESSSLALAPYRLAESFKLPAYQPINAPKELPPSPVLPPFQLPEALQKPVLRKPCSHERMSGSMVQLDGSYAVTGPATLTRMGDALVAVLLPSAVAEVWQGYGEAAGPVQLQQQQLMGSYDEESGGATCQLHGVHMELSGPYQCTDPTALLHHDKSGKTLLHVRKMGLGASVHLPAGATISHPFCVTSGHMAGPSAA